MNEIEYFVDTLEQDNGFRNIEWFAEKHNLRQKKRNGRIVALRQYFVFLLFKNKRQSLIDIGRIVNQHHSNIIHSINVARNRIEVKDPLMMEVISQHQHDINLINWEL